eukprot:846206-Prymnesium_polylepis.1
MRPCGSRQKWNTPGSKMNMKSRSPPPSCAVSKSIGRGGLVHGWLDLSRRSFQRLHTRRRLHGRAQQGSEQQTKEPRCIQ